MAKRFEGEHNTAYKLVLLVLIDIWLAKKPIEISNPAMILRFSIITSQQLPAILFFLYIQFGLNRAMFSGSSQRKIKKLQIIMYSIF